MTALANMTRDELRASWQGRALAGTKGRMASTVLSVLAHSYDEAMPKLMRAVFPGFVSITVPFFCTPARIAHNGRICVHMISKHSTYIRNAVIFHSEADLTKAFRDLADRLKLSDADRVEMFAAVNAWIVADFRKNPITGEKDKAA